jgi:hypothetical protein
MSLKENIMGTNGTTRPALALHDSFVADHLTHKFLTVSVEKVGKVVGGKNGTRFGDDTVIALLIGGGGYIRLKTRDNDVLTEALASDPNLFATLSARAASKGIVDGKGNALTPADFRTAYDALVTSIGKTLAGTNESTSGHVYEPLVVDGTSVPGCKVYVGGGDPTNSRTPKVGTIHVSGIRVEERVLVPAVNGPIPPSKSRADVVAKRLITSWLRLPSRRWRQYRLDATESFRLKVGGEAAVAAVAGGIVVTDATAEEVHGLVA